MPEVNFVTQIKGDKQVVTALSQINDRINELSKNGKSAGDKLDNTFKSSGASADTLNSSIGKLGVSFESVKGIVAGFGLTLGAVGFAQFARAAGAAMIEFESSFAGVRKTVNATERELQALSEGFRDMALAIPVSVNELNKIGESAGQLGIKTDNILGFTRTMADLGVTTNLSSDQAATSLARLANITQMSQDDFGRLGSTIVALGNNFATTESEIVEMAMRIAGAGKQIGLTEAQMMAFATTLSSVGIESEAGGSAISKVFIEIASEVETSGKKLKTFAETAGMTANEFSSLFKKDATAAIREFIVGLGNLKEEGGSSLQVLEKLGIEEVRMRDALLRASGAGGLLTDALGKANEAWRENTALTKEAEQRYKTTESQWQLFKNALSDLAITLGDVVLPPMRLLMTVTTGTLKAIGDLIGKFKEIMAFGANLPSNATDAQIKKAEESAAKLKAMGIEVDRTGKSFEQWTLQLNEASKALDKSNLSFAQFNEVSVKGEFNGKNLSEIFGGAKKATTELTEEQKKLAEQLKKLKDSHAFDFWESAQDVMTLTAESIERINLALRPNSEMDGYFASINAGLDGAITRLATIEAEASRIDPDKLMADIAKSTMEMTEVSAEILSEDFERQQELIRETERQYKEMIEDVRDGAGEVFDAIVSRGEDAFTNLGDWIEATFLSRLRKLFQNFIEWMSNGFKGGFEQVLAGVAPSLSGMGGGNSYYHTGIGGGADASGTLGQLSQIMGGSGINQGGIFGLSGSLGSLVQSGLMMGGSWAFMDSFKQKGARGWLESIGGGTALGASIGSVIPGIGTAIGAAIGAAASAISKGIQSIAKAITGPNSYEATSKEISRDFGGIRVSDKEVQSWMSSVGLKENQVWGIRQNMKTSPSFLYEVGWAAAVAQGKTDEFLKSLEKVGTSWGEFNFRTAFEIGRLTGDWSKLNEMWMETSNLGDAFKDMPEVLAKLKLGDGAVPPYEQLVKDLYELQEAIQGTLPATLDMYDTFLQTGEITDEFTEKIKELGGNIEEWRAASATIAGNTAQIASLLAVSSALAGLKNSIASTTSGIGTMYEKFLETGEISEELASQITDLGGDLAAFQSMSRLQAISSEYAQLVEHFRESGEILPRLSELFAEFGGNVSALSMDSFDLSGLTDKLSFVQSLVSQLKSSLPDPIAQLLSGKMDEDVISALTGAGLDPSAFGNLMSIIGKKNQFSASNFQAFQAMNPELEYYLKQYGGSAGAAALSRYDMGQNTITSGLLDTVQANIEKEYQEEVKKLLEYLGTVEGETQSEIDRLTQVMEDQLAALEEQFATVGSNIEKALNDSKIGVMSEIDLMLGSIQTQTQALTDAINDAKEGIVSAIDSLISGAITQGAAGSAQSNNSVTVQIDMSGSYVANSAAFYQDMAAAMETYFKNGGSLEMLGAR